MPDGLPELPEIKDATVATLRLAGTLDKRLPGPMVATFRFFLTPSGAANSVSEHGRRGRPWGLRRSI